MNISHSLKEMSLLFLVGILLLLKVVKSTYTKVEEKVILYEEVDHSKISPMIYDKIWGL